ncbi:hypothetical protein MBLNU230_g6620t1 [Neophaeotheca triangularis]
MTREHFDTCQKLAQSLLTPAHALRLSVSLEHAAFLWDCVNEHASARKLARRTIKEVYASAEGLDDDEFAEASAMVQALGGIVKKGMDETTPNSSTTKPADEPLKPTKASPIIDRTIAVTPPNNKRSRAESPTITPSNLRNPGRLSTVPEVDLAESSNKAQPTATTAPSPLSPPTSRLSGRSKPSRPAARSTHSVSSTSSDKASKRARAEHAEELYRINSASKSSRHSSGAHSRDASPPEGYVHANNPCPLDTTTTTTTTANQKSPASRFPTKPPRAHPPPKA